MSHPHDSKYASLPLRKYSNASFGIAFCAPATWQDTSGDYFQVSHNETGTQFTSSAYQNSQGISGRAWAEKRLAIAAETMPFLRPVKGMYEMTGKFGSAFAAEYSGVYPNSNYPTRYLVVCLCTEQKLISFAMTSPEESFAVHEDLYRWLLATQLSLFSSMTVDQANIVFKLQPASSASVARRVVKGFCSPATDREAHLYLPVLGDLVVSYTIPGAPTDASLPLGLMKAANVDLATLHSTSVDNMYRVIHDGLKFSQMTLVPPEPKKSPFLKRAFSSAPAPVPTYFSIETGNNLEANCILLAPIWESVKSLVKGDLRIVIPRQNVCLFCGADDPFLPMMTDTAEQLRTERPDLALSACVFSYASGSIAPVGKLTDF
jgi:hypothetical protein